jgi:small subunit ribosomal protein S3
MGQKVSPVGFRIGVIRDWESRWFAEKEYGDLLQEDIRIRKALFAELKDAAVSHIEIERTKNNVAVIIKSARPGAIIGTNGEKVEQIKKEVIKLSGGKQVNIKVVEVANPDLDAHLVGQNIAEQLEQRASFRSAQKKAIQRTMRAGAKGIKTLISGRLGGADIARKEGYSEGVTPLHTLRADIDYACCQAATQYGRLGVKVWICRGEVARGEMVKDPEAPKYAPRNDRRRGGNRRFNDRGPAQGRQNAPQAVSQQPAAAQQAPAENKEAAENVSA